MSQILDGRAEHKDDSVGVRLIKKSRKGLINIIFSRFGIIVLLLFLQVLFVVDLLYSFRDYLPHITAIAIVFTVAMVLYIFNNSNMDASSKMTWLVVIMIFQVFGAILLLYTKLDVGHRSLRNREEKLIKSTKDAIAQNTETMERLKAEDSNSSGLMKYINRTGCFPIYDNSDAVFFPSGEAKFEALLEELKKAEKYIFLEYFIIDEGVMWGKILEILIEKAAAGVDVRVMYDGTCEMSLLPHNYPKKLEKLGIKCRVFAPMRAFVSTHYNYRDHRKILVIDGKTAFNGGVNLADEYINEIDRFGYWKDTAVMVKGEAVRSFTLMFLQMWHIEDAESDLALLEPKYGIAKEEAKLALDVREEGIVPSEVIPQDAPSASLRSRSLDSASLRSGRPVGSPSLSGEAMSKGYIMPYADCPLDGERVGESVYIDILYRARNYVHIMTPYLILDGEMETALKFAAERGVDVKIILPGVPDKKVAYSLAKSHYASLLEAGVDIYEFTPGFVHAKVFCCDDVRAVVGTINLDYRSLYHHFECATYMYKTPCIADIKADFEETLMKCRRVTRESIKGERLYYKIVGRLVKLVAPLL